MHSRCSPTGRPPCTPRSPATYPTLRSRVDRELDDHEQLDVADAHVIHTPGHTDGSIALHCRAAGVLFTGDTVAEHDGHVFLGPFNTDRARARTSFRLVAGLEADVVCFGHGRPLVGAHTRALRDAAAVVPDPLG